MNKLKFFSIFVAIVAIMLVGCEKNESNQISTSEETVFVYSEVELQQALSNKEALDVYSEMNKDFKSPPTFETEE